MNKIQKVQSVFEKLRANRISIRKCSPYHLQWMTIHNFYPSTNKYYNSETGESCYYKDEIYESHGAFTEFIRSQQ